MANLSTQLTRWWRIDAAGVLGLALVSAACYYGLILPAINSRETHDALKPQITERSDAVKAAKDQFETLQNDLTRVTTELTEQPLKLEPSTQVNSRLAGLTETASDIGLDLHRVLPDPLKPGDRYDMVPILLSGEGDYGQVVGFMRSVNQNFADVAVIGFDLQSHGQPGKPAKFDIALAWYTLPAMGFVDK